MNTNLDSNTPMKLFLGVVFILSVFSLQLQTIYCLPILFVIWYVGIAFEHPLRLDKSISALFMGGFVWIKLAMDNFLHEDTASHVMGSVGGIVIFLLCAMSIVTLIELFNSFYQLKKWIYKMKMKTRHLFWLMFVLTSLLTVIIDNMTTTLILGSFCMGLLEKEKNKLLFLSMIVLVANFVGVASVLGDVTTTMEWIAGLIEAGKTTMFLGLPALSAGLVAAYLISTKIEDEPSKDVDLEEEEHDTAILVVGICSFLLIPIIHSFLPTLPPFVIIPFSLALVWGFAELRHPNQNNFVLDSLSDAFQNKSDEVRKNMLTAFSRIEIAAILFFFGILFAVDGIGHTGMIKQACKKGLDWSNDLVGKWGFDLINYPLGKISAVIDNVPLLQGAMQGFEFQPHSYEWYALAYSTGGGGNMLVIGTAAGVIALTILKTLNFGWYFKNITFIAFVSYTVGYIVMLALKPFFF